MKIRISTFALLFFLALTSSALCKRGAAPIVEPLIHKGIKYIAPNDDGMREYIQAWDIKTAKKIWELTIFTNAIQPGLEKDVQWVFIENLKTERGNLLITDEMGRQFLVHLKTRQIERINK